ncbi:MAG: DUF2017 family protein [Acidimicrobiia bacterium]|nr:DUF2017 family protein [Acidimicrobiia bacterium]
MLGRSRKLLTRGRDGAWTLHLGADERQLLASLAGELDAMLEARPDDPSLRRLHPTAYIDDEEHEAGWQLLIGEELRTTRRAQLDVLRAAAERTTLDDDEVQAWMQALNALRLVLGTRLDVSEDQEGPTDPHDPDAPAYALYEFLGYLLDRTVQSLSGR